MLSKNFCYLFFVFFIVHTLLMSALFVFIVHTYGESCQPESSTNNTQVLENHSALLSKCMERKNCTSCIEKDMDLQCYWCNNQCSSVMYLQKDCEHMKLNPEDICASDSPAVSSTLSTSISINIYLYKSGSHYKSELWSTLKYLILIFGIVSLLIMICLFIIYCYAFKQFGGGPMRLELVY